MSDHDTDDRQRRQRASLVAAFNRRAWKPSEQPRLGARVLAGGVALILVAGAAFGLGAMKSYSDRKSAEERARRSAQTTGNGSQPPYTVAGTPSSSTPSPTATPGRSRTPAPSDSRKNGPDALPAAAESGPHATAAGRSSLSHRLIKNVVTGQCVDLPGTGKGSPGGRVQQNYCNGSSGDNQRWDLVVKQKGTGPRGADMFPIRNVKDGYCLDLPGNDNVPFTSAVTEGYCHPGSGDNQMWYLDKKGTGKYWIRNVYAQGLCLDVYSPDDSRPAGAKLTVFPCTLNDDHLWYLA